jgi:hypothetical protein
MSAPASAWRRLRDFAGLGGEATFLWPRWLVLRCVGVVYAIAFAGIIVEGRALIGTRGITPASEYFASLATLFPHGIERLLRAPSLFWLGAGDGMIAFLQWAGLAAAVALILNLWPRMALLGCWAVFLSFVSAWGAFTSTIIDKLILEVALLCIAYAPAGLKPGLGASRPPRPVAVLAVRLLLLRVMLESGLIKLIRGDTHWHDLSAMEVMYETSPLPTFLGYMDQQLPHAYHYLEIALTFSAEIVAPVIAVFGGRRGRWAALAIWALFQSGIQLTTSFGWLNTASLALGLVLLDDQMLAAASRRLGFARAAGALSRPAAPAPAAAAAWRVQGLRILLGTQFLLAVYFFCVAATDRTLHGIPEARARPVDYVFRDFQSANSYIPYESFPVAKFEVEFEGSNDGGRTWRTYDFRFKPQRPDRISGHVAPWFDRFDAALQLAVNLPHSRLIPGVSAQLLRRSPDVVGLFKADPFPDRPPTQIRMPVYRLSFTDLATLRRTGNYWRKEYVGDYQAPIVLNERGNVVERP